MVFSIYLCVGGGERGGRFEECGICICLILVQMLKREKEHQELEVHEKGRARAVRIRVHPKIIMVGQKCVVRGMCLRGHIPEADPECK